MRARIFAFAAAGLLAAAVPVASFAGGPHVGVTIGIGGPPVVYYPPPPVVYYPPPAVYYPRPYYYAPPAVVFRFGERHGWRHHGHGFHGGHGHRGHWNHGHRARW